MTSSTVVVVIVELATRFSGVETVVLRSVEMVAFVEVVRFVTAAVVVVGDKVVPGTHLNKPGLLMHVVPMGQLAICRRHSSTSSD